MNSLQCDNYAKDFPALQAEYNSPQVCTTKLKSEQRISRYQPEKTDTANIERYRANILPNLI